MEESAGRQEIPEKDLVARLIIEQVKDGAIRIQGPIGDKILSYGLLDCARDAIFEHHQKLGNVIKSNGHGILNFIRRK